MALVKKPVTGMKDILPMEMEIRNRVMDVIKETYASFGFTQIETPCVENIENLNSKQGGENEKLIFNILKRGEKLNLEKATSKEDLIDCGLRYDLTVPLVRYYSNNANNLPNPFKALQMGNVWRADRPQRGRYRQFMQCDIDIFGDPSYLAEVELILATTTTLGKLDFKGFKIRINDRRILKAMASYSGFAEETYDTAFIILDKMDKIGLDGVKEELVQSGFDASAVEKFVALFEGITGSTEDIVRVTDILGDKLEEGVRDNLLQIISIVEHGKKADFTVEFDPTLVRGMGYYTGTIFEIAMPEFGGSCGGGGRYDRMVGKFTGNDVPAVGFSIGFERIVLLLLERQMKVDDMPKKTAFLVDKGIEGEKLGDIISLAMDRRMNGENILVVRMNKNKKFQKEQLQVSGYSVFEEFYND